MDGLPVRTRLEKMFLVFPEKTVPFGPNMRDTFELIGTDVDLPGRFLERFSSQKPTVYTSIDFEVRDSLLSDGIDLREQKIFPSLSSDS